MLGHCKLRDTVFCALARHLQCYCMHQLAPFARGDPETAAARPVNSLSTLLLHVAVTSYCKGSITLPKASSTHPTHDHLPMGVHAISQDAKKAPLDMHLPKMPHSNKHYRS